MILLFELIEGSRDANVVAQQVQRGYEVTPLDQLPQWAPTESIFCNLEAGLLGQQTKMDQDLTEGKIGK